MAGPLARSVADLAIMLDATVGTDPADRVTAGAGAHIPASYRDNLRADALKGARIGVVRSLFATSAEDAEGQKVVDAALERLRGAGAIVFDVAIPGLNEAIAEAGVIGFEFKEDLAAYLAAHAGSPVAGLGAIIDGGLHHDLLDSRFRLRNVEGETGRGRADPGYQVALKRRADALAATETAFEAHRVDALLYPSNLLPPPLIEGDTVANPNNCQFSASTGLPALAIPAGFTARGLPIGMELLGPAFSEPRLLALAYGWEQTAQPRQTPFSTPPLVNGAAPPVLAFTTRISSPKAEVMLRFRYHPTTARLDSDAEIAGADAPVALALHRRHQGGAGPVLMPLVVAGQSRGVVQRILDARDRADLFAGRLYAVLYTRAAPLGAGEAVLEVPKD